MAKQNVQMLAFNRGIVSPLALARVDVKHVALAAEEQTNFICSALGPMSLRPGTAYKLNTAGNNPARYIPFVFSVADTALIELTNQTMQVVVNDAKVTRVAVGTQTTNGTFNANITGWTNTSDAGGSAAWVQEITAPLGMAYNPTQGRMYVVNSAANTVSVIDTIANTVVATIPVGATPQKAVYNPTQGRLYVSNYGSNTVSAIDPTSNTVVATIPVGVNPQGLAYNPTQGRVYAANYTANTVSVIDPTTNTVVATIAVGAGPNSIAHNPTQSRLYVANYGAGTVSVIDPTSNTVVATIAGVATAFDAAYNPTQGRVYIAASGGGVVVVDPTTNTIVTTITVGANPHGIAYNPTQGRLYVSNYGAGTVSVIDPTSNTVVATIPVGVNPYGTVYDSVQGMVYVANNSANTVSVIDPIANTVVATIANGHCGLLGDGTNAGAVSQTLTIAAADTGQQHGLRVTIAQANCLLRVGSGAGLDDYVSETTLLKGTHSIALTPNGNIFVQLLNRNTYTAWVDSVTIESAGAMSLPTPWQTADLSNVRCDQSADVVFAACATYRQQRIERRGIHSWSVVNFVCDDGPFLLANTTPITITPSATAGAVMLNASKALFATEDVGTIFRIGTSGQSVARSISAQNVFSNTIEVTGVGASRLFYFNIASLTGTGSTVTLQRSFGAIGTWLDVGGYTTDQATSLNDGFDNQIVYYRLGIKTGGYSTGSPAVTMNFAGGTSAGIVRVTGYTSSTAINGYAVAPLGGTTATANWSEGAWSAAAGFPSAVSLHEGRLWFAGKGQIWGSITDDYTSNDDTFVGDAGPISRSIGSGPLDSISWLYSSENLLLGTQTTEMAARSSSLGEPLTPTNFNLKKSTTYGSASVTPLAVNDNTVFIGKTGSRAYITAADAYTMKYSATDLTLLSPEVCQPSIVRTAVQRYFDTRLHFVRSDGKVAILVFDKQEEITAWILYETTGTVEDVVVLPAQPGETEDHVYYVVARTIGGMAVRFLEKWSLISDCIGGTLNKQADAHVNYTGAPTTTISGLTHLNGQTVVCWADGIDQGTYVVAAGAITLTTPVSNATVGLGYQARFQSTKLAYAAQMGTALNQVKKVDKIGVVLANTHYQGLLYGPDYTHLDALPLEDYGQATPANTVWGAYDAREFTFSGVHDTDARVCLVANAPRPCTVMAVTLTMQTHE